MEILSPAPVLFNLLILNFFKGKAITCLLSSALQTGRQQCKGLLDQPDHHHWGDGDDDDNDNW